MENKIKELIGDALESLNLIIDSVAYEKEGRNNFLRICLDGNNIINVDMIVKATKIIDPILEKSDLIKDMYILDIYGKSKGSESNEC